MPETISIQGQAPTATTEPQPGQGQAPATQDQPGREPTSTTPQTDTNGNGQEPKTFDEAYVRQLRAEAAQYRTRATTAEAKVGEFEDKDKTEQQRLEERANTAEGRATAAETKLLRFEVAAAKGIPASLVGRLQGSTREELEQDADKLKQDFGLGANGQEPRVPNFDAGARPTAGDGDGDMNTLLRRAAGRPA